MQHNNTRVDRSFAILKQPAQQANGHLPWGLGPMPPTQKMEGSPYIKNYDLQARKNMINPAKDR
jgi:hypothetical protein